MTNGAGNASISFFGREGGLFILLGAAAVLWPLLLTGGRPFMMVDTAIYADQGEQIRTVIGGLIASLLAPSPDAVEGATPLATGALDTLRAQTAGDDTVRSISYAAFVGLLQPLGAFWVLYVQAVLVMAAVYSVVAPHLRHLPRRALAGIALLVLAASPLPTMASFLMPDIFGGVVILFALRLAMGLDALDLKSRITLSAIAIAAITFHYGNIPLAIALFALVASIRAGRRRALGAILVGGGATAVVAIGFNVIVGMVGFDTVSVAPNRAPIVLARSIADGPARWVLEEDCASDTPTYALCEHWGTDIPDNVGDALWNAGSMEDAPPHLHERIRAEEVPLLTEAFLTYPLQQSWAIVGNAVKQAFRVGTRYARPGELVVRDDGRRTFLPVEGTPFEAIRPALGYLHTASYLAALVGLAWLRCCRGTVILLLAGLAVNAAIFGGLSAPVPRYQARVAWVAVVVVSILLARRYFSRARHG
jgi:hypothetical protein